MAIDLTNSEQKQGALDALRVVLTSKRRPIILDQEDDEAAKKEELKLPKNTQIRAKDETDEEEETPAEKEQRIERIKDTSEVSRDLADIKQDTQIRKADAERARNKELQNIARLASGNLVDFSNFEADLYRTIKSQVATAKHTEDSYSRPNPTYAGTDYLMPGQDYPDKKDIPSIAIYFDQSSSWTASDLQRGIDALACIREFERKKKIKKIDVWYFANSLHSSPKGDPNDYWWESGTGGFGEVLQSIKDHNYSNVIIMTDDDIESQTRWSDVPAVIVKGCVWFIWRYGQRSATATKYLQGEKGTYEYRI